MSSSKFLIFEIRTPGAGIGAGPPAVRDGPERRADPFTGVRGQSLLPVDRPHPDAEEDLPQPRAVGCDEDHAGIEDAVRLAMRGADPPRPGRRPGLAAPVRVGAPELHAAAVGLAVQRDARAALLHPERIAHHRDRCHRRFFRLGGIHAAHHSPVLDDVRAFFCQLLPAVEDDDEVIGDRGVDAVEPSHQNR